LSFSCHFLAAPFSFFGKPGHFGYLAFSSGSPGLDKLDLRATSF